MKLAAVCVLLAFGGCISPLCAQTALKSENEPGAEQSAPSRLYGMIDGDIYIFPRGIYRVKIPVLPELGGNISDSPNVVTFDDDYTTRITIAAFPLSPELKSEYEKRGAKGFLVYFFTTLIMPDLVALSPSAQMEQNAIFLPKFRNGAILICTLLPGGSYFEQRMNLSRWLEPAVAKRGNLCFVEQGYVFIISTELAERVLERSTYRKTPEEENAILSQRLLDLAGKMQFAGAPPEVRN